MSSELFFGIIFVDRILITGELPSSEADQMLTLCPYDHSLEREEKVSQAKKDAAKKGHDWVNKFSQTFGLILETFATTQLCMLSIRQNVKIKTFLSAMKRKVYAAHFCLQFSFGLNCCLA